MPYKDEAKNLALRQRWRKNNPTYQVKYAQNHREQFKGYAKKRKAILKAAVFEAYGGAICACCHETHLEFLSIDHISGGGAAHRRALGEGHHMTGNNFYKWLRDNAFPPGFRVLCMNCNFSLGHWGYCPHGGVENVTNPMLKVNRRMPSQNILGPTPISAHPTRILNGIAPQLGFIGFGDESSNRT